MKFVAAILLYCLGLFPVYAQQLVKNQSFEDSVPVSTYPAFCGQTTPSQFIIPYLNGVYERSYSSTIGLTNTLWYYKNMSVCPQNWYAPHGNAFIEMLANLYPVSYGRGSRGVLFLSLKNNLSPNVSYLFRGYFLLKGNYAKGFNFGTTNTVDTFDLVSQQLFQNNSTGPVFLPTDTAEYWRRINILFRAIKADTMLALTIEQDTSMYGSRLFLDNLSLFPYIVLPQQQRFSCGGDTIVLTAQQGGINYEWSTGLVQDTLPTLKITQPGWYVCNIYSQDTAYIDSIEVIYNPDSVAKMRSFNKTFCSYPITIGLDELIPNMDSAIWSTGATTFTEIAPNIGTYWRVAFTDTSCAIADTFHVTQDFPTPLNLTDTTFCQGDTLLLNAQTPPYTSYVWNTGTTGATIEVTDTGTYIVTATDHYCITTDTIHVGFINPPNLALPTDTAVCKGEAVVLDASHSFYQNYLWNTGATTANISVEEAGVYTVIASDTNHCTTNTSIHVQHYELPVVTLPNDTALCLEEVLLILDAGEWKSYRWLPTDETTQTINVKGAAKYVVIVTDSNNCKGTDNIGIDEECPTELYIPTAFSPDANNLNDVFEPRGRNIMSYKIFIFNRWGNMIYEGNKPWNGMYNNKPVEIGVYGYIIEVKTKQGKLIDKKGTVTIIR